MAAARKKAEYQLKQRLNKCRNAPDILRVAAGGVITAEVAAHTLHILAGQGISGPPSRGRSDWDAVLAGVVPAATKMSVRQFTKAVLAAAKLGFDASGPVVHALLEHAVSIAADMDARCVSNTLWSIGKIHQQGAGSSRPPPSSHGALVVLVSRAKELAAEYNATDLANTLWSFAILQQTINDSSNQQGLSAAVAAVCSRAGDIASELSGKELVNMIWAAAKLEKDGVRATDMAKLQNRAADCVSSFSSRDVASTFWGIAQQPAAADARLTGNLLEAARQLRMFNAQDLANTGWSLQRLAPAELSEEFAMAFARRAADNATRFTPQHLAQLITFASELDVSKRAAELLSSTVQKQLETKAFQLSPQGVQAAAKALVKLRALFPAGGAATARSFAAVATRAKALLSADLAETGRLNPAHATNLLWAAATLSPGNNDGDGESSGDGNSGGGSSSNVVDGGGARSAAGNSNRDGGGGGDAAEAADDLLPAALLVEAVSAAVGTMPAEATVHTAWGLAKLGIPVAGKNAATLAARLNAVAPDLSGSEKSHRLAAAAWAWAKLGLRSVDCSTSDGAARGGMFQKVLAQALPEIDSKHLGLLAWGFAAEQAAAAASAPTFLLSGGGSVVGGPSSGDVPAAGAPPLAASALRRRLKNMDVEELSAMDWKSVARLDLWLRLQFPASKNANLLAKLLKVGGPTVRAVDQNALQAANAFRSTVVPHLTASIAATQLYGVNDVSGDGGGVDEGPQQKKMKKSEKKDKKKKKKKAKKGGDDKRQEVHVLLADCRANGVCDVFHEAGGTSITRWDTFEGGSSNQRAQPWPDAAPDGAAGGYDACCIVAAGAAEMFRMQLAAVASVVKPGGRIWVLGRRPISRALMEPWFGAVEALCTGSAGCCVTATLLLPANDVKSSSSSSSSSKEVQPQPQLLPPSTLKGWRSSQKLVLPQGKESQKWSTYPGLFAGGGVDVMTAAFLSKIPVPRAGATILDFACGSGVIGATVHARQPSAKVTLLDAGALALNAAKRNFPAAVATIQSDSWSSAGMQLVAPGGAGVDAGAGAGAGAGSSFDWVLSNPPVHDLGGVNDFEVVRALVDGAANVLRPGGVLWMVTQELIPAGMIIDESGRYGAVEAIVDDVCRFVVWKAAVLGCDGKEASNLKRARGSEETVNGGEGKRRKKEKKKKKKNEKKSKKKSEKGKEEKKKEKEKKEKR